MSLSAMSAGRITRASISTSTRSCISSAGGANRTKLAV